MKLSRGPRIIPAPHVAPLYGEGRGLKRKLRAGDTWLTRRSSLWRGAWIETDEALGVLEAKDVAPLYGEGRGLKRWP